MESRAFTATEQTRENPAFGKLATPDEAEIELAKEGLIGVAFQASWKPSVDSACRAALFVDGVQFSLPNAQENALQEAGDQHEESASLWASLFTTAEGLQSRTPGGGFTPAATGQIIGYRELGGGGVLIPAAAGAHIITVQFRAVSGLVAVKNRKLVVWSH
jgi:hypothetical protein